mgnify:CR=1 FL=1
MLAYAARVALFFKQKKGQLQNRKQRKILERGQYTKETAVIDTAQAVQVLEKIRPCEKAECKELTFRGGCAVSVIIPVYNAAGTLSKCLDSVCGQKLMQGFEVICVNDGSTDGSADILSEYEKRYPELVVIEEENRGGAGARNCGLQKAEGKYLFFLDADDFLPQGVLQKLLDDAQKSGAEIVIGKTAKCLTSREIIVKPRTEGSREKKAFGQPENTEWERRGANCIKLRSGKGRSFLRAMALRTVLFIWIFTHNAKNFILRELRATVSEAAKTVCISDRKIRRKASTHSGL